MTLMSFTSSQPRRKIIIHCLYITLTVLVFNSVKIIRSQDSSSDSICILKPASNTTDDPGVLCDVIHGAYGRTRLENCKSIAKNEQKIKSCNDIPKGCNLELDIHYFTSYPAFTKKPINCLYINSTETFIYRIILNQTQPISPENEFTQLFPNSNEITINSLQLIQVKFTVPPIPFIKRHFKEVYTILFDHIETEESITPGLDELPRLMSFSAIGGTLGGIKSQSFVLAGNFTTVDISKVGLIKERIEENTFIVPDTDCRSRNLTVSLADMELASSVFEGELFDFKQTAVGSSCSNVNVNLNLAITGQSFEKIIPEKIFSSALSSILQSKVFTTNLKFDGIDCCMNENKWFFESIKEPDETLRGFTKGQQLISRNNFDIDCIDLGTSILEYRNVTALEGTCYNRNVNPILIIAIVSIFMLAIMLSIFSFICIVHILPRRNQEVVMNNRLTSAKTASLLRSSDKSSDILELLSTQTSGQQRKNPFKRQPTVDKHPNRAKHRPTSPIRSINTKSPSNTFESAMRHHKSPKIKHSSTNLPKAKHRSPSHEVRELNLPKNVYSLPGFRNKGHSKEKKYKSPNKSPKEQNRLDTKTYSSDKAEKEQLKWNSQVKSQIKSPVKSPLNTVDSKQQNEKDTVKTLESKPVFPGKKVATKSQEIVSVPKPLVTKESEKSLGEQMSLAFKTVN